jgi:hypothetical protein
MHAAQGARQCRCHVGKMHRLITRLTQIKTGVEPGELRILLVYSVHFLVYAHHAESLKGNYIYCCSIYNLMYQRRMPENFQGDFRFYRLM